MEGLGSKEHISSYRNPGFRVQVLGFRGSGAHLKF